MPPKLTKAAAVQAAKSFRLRLDALLQEMKNHRVAITFSEKTESTEFAIEKNEVGLFLNHSEAVAQHVLSIRDLEGAIMRQGMVLKNIGTPNPYPTSKDPSSPVVEPTADGLKM
jgi:hypothetical protein